MVFAFYYSEQRVERKNIGIPRRTFVTSIWVKYHLSENQTRNNVTCGDEIYWKQNFLDNYISRMSGKKQGNYIPLTHSHLISYKYPGHTIDR